VKINDLRKVDLENQGVTHGTANERQQTRILRNPFHWERGRLDRRVWRPAKHISVFSSLSRAGRETRPETTETVALPKIHVHSRAFAVAVALPRNCLTLNGIHIILYSHDENHTISVQNLKTSRRLLGMIFLEGVGSTLVAQMQLLTTTTTSKKPKKRILKHQIVLLGPPFFCQNAPKKARFFCQY